ncbi:type II toxin-antitoxin system HicB family antitoxin [Cupriavidus alkaliphilus]|uniref:type II toxin-antitoxin system HicB family antitoxin n=1 Tax=Cupriavidus alkaliphilus TaxID=942866 RepID=UPI000B87BD37|nr:type II toxin-antitoxin system HicB family antitoxin [Cupriavidus alkaliphilus]
MLYPVHIEPGDATHAYDITVPDFPGCFSAADDWPEIPGKVQEAAEAYYADGAPIPEPSDRLRWVESRQFEGGFWLLVEIALSRGSID